MMTNARGQRQRADGTWTYATEEYDVKFYWPLGQRVSFRGFAGTITKANRTTAMVTFDDPAADAQYKPYRIAHTALSKI